MRAKKELVFVLLSLVLLAALLQGIGYLLLPELDVSGTNWKSYREEPEDSIQVMFVGSSVVFCDISPAVVYRESGITSYIISGPEQSLPISYYYIREACKTQKPEAIFVELKGLFFPQYGEHTIANLAFMPHGLNRLEAILKTARQEDVPGLLLPVLDYHERWNDLTIDELKERLRPAQVSANAGYMARDSLQEQGEITQFHPSGDYVDECVRYLRIIEGYCAENDIALYLFLAPVTNTVDQETKEWIISLIAEMRVAGYYDFSTEEAFQSIGLDKKTDWSDNIHLNNRGTERFSAFLGNLMKKEGFLPNINADQSIWKMRESDFSNGL